MVRTVYSNNEIRKLLSDLNGFYIKRPICQVNGCTDPAVAALEYDCNRDPITIHLCNACASQFELELIEIKNKR